MHIFARAFALFHCCVLLCSFPDRRPTADRNWDVLRQSLADAEPELAGFVRVLS